MRHTDHPQRFRMSIFARLALVLVLLATLTPATGAAPGGGRDPHHVQLAPVEPPRQTTRLQQPASSPAQPSPQSQIAAAASHVTDPRDMKLLVISADGNEMDLAVIQAFLDQIGVPYDVMIATRTTLVQASLWDGVNHGYYQAVILATGNLVYYDAGTNSWPSAFDDAEWNILWAYEAMFGVRQLTSYTAPFGYPDYGLRLDPDTPVVDTTNIPLQATLTEQGRQVYPYLAPANPLVFKNTWVYLAKPIDPATTTPLVVTADGFALASIHTYPDGRQNLAVTAANSPYMLHSLLLSYGNLNWVMNGLFLGERHVNLSAQADDLLFGDAIWDPVALSDTTGLIYRLTGDDYNVLVAWQTRVRTAYPTAGSVTLELAYNGQGASGIYSPDTLTPAVVRGQAAFRWVNHTYAHQNLDAPTSYTQSLAELTQNDGVAVSQLGLVNYSKDALVQPSVSGLYNAEFQRAAKDWGLRFLVSDSSQAGWNNPSPNTGFYSTYQPSLLIIPRRPTNLFYNVSTPAEWVSEYNCYYGPNGTCAGGAWRYWDHDLTYAEILDKESDVWLQYLLKWDLDPLMFHQSNLRAYDGASNLLGDLIQATLAKYRQLYTLPIRSLSQHQIGLLMAGRMAYNASGVRATLWPCASIAVVAARPAQAPITGLNYGTNVETYGGQPISYLTLDADRQLTLRVVCQGSQVSGTSVVQAGQDQLIYQGDVVKLDPVTFLDNSALAHTATIDWGDGTPVTAGLVSETPFGPAGNPLGVTGAVSGTHQYRSAPGAYIVTVTLTGSDRSTSDTLRVMVVHGFVRYCVYGNVDDPGVVVHPDAVVQCDQTPSGVPGEMRDSGLRARQRIEVRDRASITGNLVSQFKNVEVDKDVLIRRGGLVAGNDAKLGDRSTMTGSITAGHRVELKAGAGVWGDVTAADSVNLNETARVTGTISPFTRVPPVSGLTFAQFVIVPGLRNVSVASGASVDLAPGVYAELRAGDRSTLKLHSGRYVFKKMTVGNDSRVLLDLTAGSIVVDSVDTVELGDRTQMTIVGAGDAKDIVFRVAIGEVRLGKEGTYVGTYIAARNKIELRDAATLTGALYGKKVEVKAGASLIGRPALDVFIGLFVRSSRTCSTVQIWLPLTIAP